MSPAARHPSSPGRGISRRLALAAPAAALTGWALTGCASDAGESPGQSADTPNGTPAGTPADTSRVRWRMPDEGERHTRTWMAYGASRAIWGADLLPTVRTNLVDVANTIAEFEPVTMLVRPGELAELRRAVSATVTLQAQDVDDLWIRDTGPTFVADDAGLAGVDFNFNGWGGKQEHTRDATVAAAVCRDAGVPRVTTDLVLEGGALEVDGRGTAIITRSCVLNDNRNPGWTAGEVEAELGRLVGIRKVIWLPGIAGKDITDGHTDFYARFTAPGHVVAALDPDPASFDHDVTATHLDILHAATDADGNPLTVTTLTAPSVLRATDPGGDFAAGYVNFYVCNGGVVAPQFGDREADAAAYSALAAAFPDREVVQVDIDGIAAGGGGIHCATQQQPAG